MKKALLTFLKHTQVVLIAAYQASQNHIYLEQLEENQKENQWVALESCDQRTNQFFYKMAGSTLSLKNSWLAF